MFSFSALSWKPLFLFFSLFSAAQDNITEVVAELSSISCFFAFFLFLYFAFCFCYCELLFACSRISHGRNDARREVGGLDRARPSPGDNKDYFANCDHEKGKSLGRGSNNQNGNLRWLLPWRGGGSRGGLKCHIPILKNYFFENHLESFPDC